MEDRILSRMRNYLLRVDSCLASANRDNSTVYGNEKVVGNQMVTGSTQSGNQWLQGHSVVTNGYKVMRRGNQ